MKYREPYLEVEIIEPSKEDTDKYYTTTGDIKMSSSSQNSVRVFKKAIIKKTFDSEKYPIDSEWMMGESPGMKVSFFGEPKILIQEKDLYARIDNI